MVEVSRRAVAGDWSGWLVDELIGDVSHCLRSAAEEIRGINPSHREDQIDTD